MAYKIAKLVLRVGLPVAFVLFIIVYFVIGMYYYSSE